MNKKIGGYIYLIGIICILLCISICIVSNKKSTNNIVENINNSHNVDNETNSAQNLNSDSEEDAERIKKLNEELRKAEVNSLYHRGEYPNRADSREVNPEFITDECIIRDPLDGYEIEFTSYEETYDISEYLGKDGIMHNEYNYYVEDGIINSDGTLNTITYKYKERLNDGVYGEEFTIEDYELVAIKLKFKLKNTETKSNDIDTAHFLTTNSFIYMDDGKLYRRSSMYYCYDLDTTTSSYPIYHSFMNKINTPEGVYPTMVTLEPLEEIEGEIIYILGKQDLDNIYLTASANNANIENFNGVYITFLPFKELANLQGK